MLPITLHASYQTDKLTVFKNVSIMSYMNHVELQICSCFSRCYISYRLR